MTPRTRLSLRPLEDRRTPATFTVTTLADGPPVDDAELTLREAVAAADGNGEADTILFESSLSGSISLDAEFGELDIDSELDIAGPGADVITVDAGGNSRVFDVGYNAGDVSISGLTITGGRVAFSGEVPARGAGIRAQNSGSLTLTGVRVVDNEAADSFASGGGVFARNGGLDVVQSEISGNTSAGNGGGVAFFNTYQTYGDYYGLTVSNSTVAGNTASAGDGGGIYVFGRVPVTVENSTVTGNSAGSDGGGLGVSEPDNTAIEIAGTVIAENTDSGDGSNPDLSFSSDGIQLPAPDFLDSLIGDAAGTDVPESQTQDPVTGNIVGRSDGGGVVDPLLGPLQDNGGPTQTRAPLEASPVLNAGGDTGPDTDQRGAARGAPLNIGAFEGDAVAFEVAGFPSPIDFGEAGNFTVTPLDEFGETDFGYTGTVTFSSSDAAAGLPEGGPAGDFEATLNTPGTQSITATDSADAAITGTQADIEVVNDPPTLDGATATIDENAAAGTFVIDLDATDPQAADSLTYSITGTTFAIDAAAGEVTVADPAALDFEANESLTETVTVTDLFGETDTAALTVNLNDVNEAPTADDASFEVAENSPAGTPVGTVTAADPEDNVVSFAIVPGDPVVDFAIDNATGEITVANPAGLDFEAGATFELTALVTDAGGLTDTAAVTIAVTDVNEPPVVTPADGLTVPENAAPGTVIPDAFAAADPDGDAVAFTVTEGGDVFAIDGEGDLAVLNSAALNFEVTQEIAVTVIATDSGGAASEPASVTVSILDVPEPVPPPVFVVGGPPDSLASVIGTSGGQAVPAAPVQAFFLGQSTVDGSLARADALNPVRPTVGNVVGDAALDFVFGASPLSVIDAETAAQLGLGETPDALVSVIDGTSGARFTFRAFEPGFKDGVFVDTGDFNGDGVDEIVVGPDVGGSGRIRVLEVAGAAGDVLTFNVLADFFGIEDPAYRGGARIAVGDVNGDGTPDIAVAAAEGGGPRVALWDGALIQQGAVDSGDKVIGDIFAFGLTGLFGQNLTDGVFPALGDVDGDGFADLTVGAGAGDEPEVRIFSGAGLAFGDFDPADPAAVELARFQVGAAAPELTGGVRVAAVNLDDGDALADVLAHNVPVSNRLSADTPASPNRGELKVYAAADLLAGQFTPAPLTPFAPDQFFGTDADDLLFDGIYFG